MSATTIAKRKPKHPSNGGTWRQRPYAALAIGGVFFIIAWAVWTFWFSAAIP